MNKPPSQTPLLKVPYFQQTRHATCGPAALMMIFKYWDPTYKFSRSIETQIWRKSRSILLFGATLQYRLAAFAKKQGYITEIYQHTPPQTPLNKLLIKPAEKAHIPIQYIKDFQPIFQKAIKKKIPPLVLLNILPIIGENVYHWLVITGLDEQNIYVNDPYIPKHQTFTEKKHIPIPHHTFTKALMINKTGFFHLPSAAILIYR
jgi:hypothetical protein